MKVYTGKQKKKGFTMVEVILVVAVLSVLLALAVPGVVRLTRELKLTKLDGIAKEIYTSAQSRAVSLSVSGQLSQVGGNPLPNAATPLTADAGGDASKIRYVTEHDTPVKEQLLPQGSIEEVVRQNYYIIEYDPVTAAVICVYYWENQDNNFADPTGSGYGTVDPHNKAERMNYSGGMVGYYDGPPVERPAPSGEDANSPVEAKLFNNEELYLEITQGCGAGGPLKGMITVTLTDLDTGKSKQMVSFDNDGSDIGGRLSFDGTKFTLILDSLREGLRFAKLRDELGAGVGSDDAFHPGCELKVTVTYQEEGKLPQSQELRTNSLYDSVSGSVGDRTAYIAYGRHLENLGLYFVYPHYGMIDMNDTLTGVKRAVQIRNIDWKVSLSEVGGGPASFTPIVKKTLESYDGQGNTISHANIANTGGITEGLGLFGKFEGNTLENVNLVNCNLEGSGSDSMPAGLLAGRVEPVAGTCVISNCRAYAEKEKEGENEVPIKIGNCFIDAPEAVTAGGLLGYVQNANLYQCSASLTKLAGDACVGGLAGQTGGEVTIENCYADTGLWLSTDTISKWVDESGLHGTTAGGLLGYADSTLELKNSYAAGLIRTDGSVNAYGLVGDGSANSMKYCYAAVVKGDSAAQLVPDSLTGKAEAGGCANFIGGGQDITSFMTAAGSAFVTATAGTTHAYGMPDTPDPGNPNVKNPPVYPFPRLANMPHYGDWPEAAAGGLKLAYYEVYENDGKYSIGFYSNQYEEKQVKPILNTLQNDEEFTVVMDGYAVMLPAACASADLTVNYNGGLVTEADLKLMGAGGKFADEQFTGKEIKAFDVGGVTEGIDGNGDITLDNTAYHPLFLSSAMMTEKGNVMAEKDAYYQRLEVRAGTFAVNVYFNPYAAKSEFAFVDAGGRLPGETEPLAPEKSLLGLTILRTSRQLTEYSTSKAMKATATGSGTESHTLRLERNIDCTEPITTDGTLSSMACQDLHIPGTAPNVVLELNSKTLTGMGKNSSAVSSEGGTLEIYGYTKKKPERPEGSPMGTIKAAMSKDIPVVSAKGDVTLIGCTVLDTTADSGEAAVPPQ